MKKHRIERDIDFLSHEAGFIIELSEEYEDMYINDPAYVAILKKIAKLEKKMHEIRLKEPKLKPCPFCGKKAYYYTSTFKNKPNVYDIGCKTDNCCMKSGTDVQYSTRELAAKEWNRRE